MTLAEKIQKLRKENGLSQDQLALELGVSRQSVSKWELGDSMPDIAKILQLADYFQVSTDYLLREAVETIDPSPLSADSVDDPSPLPTDSVDDPSQLPTDSIDTSIPDSSTTESFDQSHASEEPQKKNPFQKAFQISLWITIAFCVLPFLIFLLGAVLFRNGGARMGTTELLLMLIVAYTTVVPVAGILTLIFWILKHTRK